MLTRVIRVRARVAVGDTVMAYGRAAVVVHLLPREPGRPRAARATHDPPCRACNRRLEYDDLQRDWQCPDCGTTYSATALAAVCGEVERNARRLWSGTPSRDALLESATGAERHAMRWALRDTGDGPLSPARCRQAVQVLVASRWMLSGPSEESHVTFPQRSRPSFPGSCSCSPVMVCAAAWYYACEVENQAREVEHGQDPVEGVQRLPVAKKRGAHGLTRSGLERQHPVTGYSSHSTIRFQSSPSCARASSAFFGACATTYMSKMISTTEALPPYCPPIVATPESEPWTRNRSNPHRMVTIDACSIAIR